MLVLSSTEAHAFGAADVAFAADLGRRIGVTIQTGSLLREATQFTATVDASLDAVLLIDPESLRIRYANEGALAQLGYTRAEFLLQKGDSRAALADLRAAKARMQFDYPRRMFVVSQLDTLERLAGWGEKLPAVLRGELKPATGAEYAVRADAEPRRAPVSR